MDTRSLQIANYRVEAKCFNEHFILLTGSINQNLPLLGEAIFESNLPWIEELINSETEICIKINESFNQACLEDLLKIKPSTTRENHQYTIPIYFEQGSDWTEIQAITGLSFIELKTLLTNTEFVIAMHGFLPGFVYLKGLPEVLQLPRKSTPAKHRNKGDLACGGPYLGIYNVASPGGWYHLGSTPLNLLDLTKLPLSPFKIGDQLNLRSIDSDEYDQLRITTPGIFEYNSGK